VEHDDTIYDICDFDGKICISGRLHSGVQHQIDLSKLNSGRYQLYIIDEGDIKREIINLN
jgi:hypothetical protein